MKAKYIYDHSKRMWYRHASSCCAAILEKKMLFQNKPVKPDFKIQTSTKVPVLKTICRKWYQLWKPRNWTITTGTKTEVSYKKVQFRYYCTECGKQNNGSWDFVHEESSPNLNPNKGVSEGQLALSKSAGAGSSPATPAKQKEEKQ